MLDQQYPPATSTTANPFAARAEAGAEKTRQVAMVDVVVEWSGDLETLAHKMRSATAIGGFRLSEIFTEATPNVSEERSRPAGRPRWYCRFAFATGSGDERELPWLLSVIGEHMRWVPVEKHEPGADPVAAAPATRALEPS